MLQAGLGENKALEIKEEPLALDMPPTLYQLATPSGCFARGQVERQASGTVFRLPYPLNLSSLFVNPGIKALTFNETEDDKCPNFSQKKE